jgi:hypothetical protein
MFDDTNSPDFFLLLQKESRESHLNALCFSTSGEETVISDELAVYNSNTDRIYLPIKFSSLNQNNRAQYKIAHLTSLLGSSDTSCKLEVFEEDSVQYLKFVAFNTEIYLPLSDARELENEETKKELKKTVSFTVSASDFVSMISACSLFAANDVNNSLLSKYYFKINRDASTLLVTSGNGNSICMCKSKIQELSRECSDEQLYFNVSFFLLKPLLIGQMQSRAGDYLRIELDHSSSYLRISNAKRELTLLFQQTEKQQLTFSDENYVEKTKNEGENKVILSLASDRLSEIIRIMSNLAPEIILLELSDEQCVASNYVERENNSSIASYPIIKKSFAIETLEVKSKRLMIQYRLFSKVAIAMRDASQLRVTLKENNTAIAEDRDERSSNEKKILFLVEDAS